MVKAEALHQCCQVKQVGVSTALASRPPPPAGGALTVRPAAQMPADLQSHAQSKS